MPRQAKRKKSKKDAKVILIDRSKRKNKRDTTNSSPDNRVLVPDEIIGGLRALAAHRAANNSSDAYSLERNIGYAKKFGYSSTAKWIEEHSDDYLDGVSVGFITEERLIEYKASRKIYDKYNGDLTHFRDQFKKSKNGDCGGKGRGIIFDALMTYKFIHREKLIGLLIANGISKKFDSARRYLNGLLTRLRKEGYLIIKSKNYYSIKGVTEDVVKNVDEAVTNPELKEEKEMAKKKRNAKKVTVRKANKKTPAKSKKEATKKPAKKDDKSIVGFIIKELESGEHTKRELAKKIMKSGMSTMKDENQVVKYLNVTFYKFRKRGMSLKKKDKPKDGGGTVGYFRLEASKK